MSATNGVYIVLYGFAIILVGCTVAILIGKAKRGIRHRLDAPLRRRLAKLPAQVALDERPPTAPRRGRARRVARELVLEGTVALTGPAKARVASWFEANGYIREAIRTLRGRFRSGRRAAAAAALGHMGNELAAPALAGALVDRRYRVRDAAATALGRVATPAEVPALVTAIARRDVPRGILSSALLHLQPAADAVLIDCLGSPDAKTRELIARVLGMRRSVTAVPALMHALDDPAPDVRRHAILAIAEIAAYAHLDVDPQPLIRLSVDDESIVRAAAATGLGQILGDRAGTVLTSMTQDPDYWVSHRAAESLCRLPSGAELGWRVLCDHRDGPGARHAKTACLEWLERTGGLETLMDGILARGDDAELVEALEVLDGIGSRAWGDILNPPAPVPEPDAAVSA